jgi:hypothetical protein
MNWSVGIVTMSTSPLYRPWARPEDRPASGSFRVQTKEVATRDSGPTRFTRPEFRYPSFVPIGRLADRNKARVQHRSRQEKRHGFSRKRKCSAMCGWAIIRRSKHSLFLLSVKICAFSPVLICVKKTYFQNLLSEVVTSLPQRRSLMTAQPSTRA